MKAYDEVIEFIAAGPTTSTVASFQASPKVRRRVGELIRREKTEGLSAEEKSELDHYAQLEHIMRMAKARARQRLGHG